jgi:hypothetical protein
MIKVRPLLKVLLTVFLVLVSMAVGLNANAATYFLSPGGSDSNSGTSSAPWRTFDFATPKLRGGDTLILKNGTYGPLSIDCSESQLNGSSSQLIRIKAENERQALVTSSQPNPGPFMMRNCSYWIIEGLHIKHRDIGNANDEAHLFSLWNSSNITVKRNLIEFTNRWTNGHVIYLHETTNSLIEENEVYSFHRHGILIRNGSTTGNNIVRRNYVNPRVHLETDIGAPVQSSGVNSHGGDICLGTYPSNNNKFENNISENCKEGNVIISGGIPDNNKLLGNINRTWIGTALATIASINEVGLNNIAENQVNIGFGDIQEAREGLYGYGVGIVCTNCTMIGFASWAGGVTITKDSQQPINSKASFDCINCLSISNPGYGFYIDTGIISNWTLQFPAVYNNKTNFYPATNSRITNPVILASNELGSCKVFVPSSAKSLKGKGKNGADIGANVLYRYENGVLTSQPLWNPITGEFPGGAIISGVNDLAGSSRFDVHKRLNVNTNGCSFPAGYGSTASTSPSTSPVGTSPSASSSSPSAPGVAYSQFFAAESANLSAPMSVSSDSKALGGKYISPASGAESMSPVREASIPISLPAAGTYYLWARIMGPNYESDALYVGIDSSWDRIFPTTTGAYEWVRVENSNGSGAFGFNLTQGAHTIQVGRGEVGARLDALLVTNNASEVPTAAPPTSPPSSPVNLVVTK